ncbi:Si-specific NAD(P)(+) transhydrogenase [Calycomorphotria hydatis]|uniref:Soluble pyridine nucleotide transhydrogenase n=1 Tax=Calycomorphotria hydatis TaxID=2528027 RepID=A0A517TCE5_9PLAN|nr:Si-specific NAD(P)(+) transhydrogenase [Calycomorphotria hydatis]QDT66033.1 Soluble pyridine nucleotide transhydrogenase [Calycomorphotria hydatis]
MQIDHKYDIVVIGTGPGGEGAAMQAVKEGRDVAVIERYTRIGGGCTHWGTIPSKALRFAIFKLTELNTNPLFRQARGAVNLTFPELRKGAESVIDKQVQMRRGFYDRNGVEVFSGHGRFLDLNTIEVLEDTGVKKILQAENFVLAPGSRPYRHPEVDFSHPRVFDSDTILNLGYTPRSITIYGAGVIGCEYASMFRNLGCKVNLVNTRDKLLEFLDDEIIDALSYHLRDRGVLIRHRESMDHVEPRDDGVILHLKSGKKFKTDALLWAAGRQGNTEDLGLEHLDITPNKRGQIDVDEHLQTSQPHIYAAGDVIGPPSLASAAYVQGRYTINHLIHGEENRELLKDIPTGIYTSPEISSLGKTERELTEGGIPYEVGQAMFKSMARAQITGTTVGMLKILFHRDTLELLGIHCFGQNAAEIIHIGQAIMSQKGEANTLKYFMNTTFNYPTMAEAYRVAALNGFNRLF